MNNKEIIKLAMQVGVLKNVKRHGWVLKDIQKVESVADHVFRVSFLTMFLSRNTGLDRERMIKMALVHDVGESLVGDTVYESGTRTIASLDKKHEDERRAMREIFKDLEDKEEYLSLWEEWVAQETPEAKFVKLVEKIEMVIQALEYEGQAYQSTLFDEFWENAKKYLQGSLFEPLFEELKKERKRLTVK